MKNTIFILSLLVFVGVTLGGLMATHPFGEPLFTAMDSYFLANAQSERAVNNVCTAIVFDYRGFDTIGEASVLFTAVSSVLALFRRRDH